uniref:Uncharacterized protein n=1 Tax=Candidatus Kentrum sp. MB TaxID=2138164 RepID=A0A450XM02_9GAMM|nr:MAG: hypothetical protein BECKMB1821G_GA0114241_102134 [Candidatus Kentron sp. MB]VFK30353.1 MAG: hypothetical protein BECKMB1821I_GA0114274_101514 [Candidatus Kentron sp. MB]VFK75182.1 MAG: hypothetical protein BECKMB1821H_GA0114242_101714 [Candidatus Kentron sp. MB]
MLTTIEGVYKDGQIRLLEQPVDVDEARVLVTLLLPEIRELPGTAPKVGDLLADKVKLDVNIDTDPVREVLDELRAERGMRWRKLDKMLDPESES